MIIPTMRYKDAPAAIKWLCDTFGFEQHMIIPGEGNMISHAQLNLGRSMIMLGSVKEDEFGKYVYTPAETGGHNTQSIYVLIEDIEAHYERTKAAGADIITELGDTDYGSREYACKDIEGHLWSFGTYDPWEEA